MEWGGRALADDVVGEATVSLNSRSERIFGSCVMGGKRGEVIRDSAMNNLNRLIHHPLQFTLIYNFSFSETVRRYSSMKPEGDPTM